MNTRWTLSNMKSNIHFEIVQTHDDDEVDYSNVDDDEGDDDDDVDRHNQMNGIAFLNRDFKMQWKKMKKNNIGKNITAIDYVCGLKCQ